MKMTIYACPMHSDVRSDKPGTCPKCGMNLVPKEVDTSDTTKKSHITHEEHEMKPVSEMSWWEKFKMSMTMSMGMEHGGLAGREMAKLMEEDIRNKFFLLAIPVAAGVLYPGFGISLRPEVSALLMSLSSIIVATNAVLLNRAEKDLVTV